MFLTREELQELTGRIRHSAQVRALRSMGIEHRRRPDGSVAVLRAHVETMMGCEPGRTEQHRGASPNWDAI